MFEAYKVAVKVSLINEVSPAIAAMSRQFLGAQKDVDGLNERLKVLKNYTMAGAAMSASGIFGIGLIAHAIRPAEEYARQLNIMNVAGMKQAEIADAISSSWKLASQNITTTATGNLKAILDLRNITGSLQEAQEFLPIMQRMSVVLAASKEGTISSRAGDLAFSAMKALDIRGAVNDPARLKLQADLMTRVIEGTQGRVTPEQFQSVFQYARQAKFSLSNDFAYKILPTLMLEAASSGGAGGGSRGVGPGLAALYRLTNQGYVNRQSLPLLAEMGLLGKGKILNTTTPGTVVAPLTGANLAASNPYEWTNQVVLPRVLDYLKRHHMAASDENILHMLNMVSRGNQLAGSLLGEFYVKRANFARDQRLLEGVMSPDEAYQAAMTRDPATAHRALAAAWTNLQTSATVSLVPIIIPALTSLAKTLNDVGEMARAYPTMTKAIVGGTAALAGAMAVGGPLITGIALTRFAFGGLGGTAATLPLKLAGVTTALGVLAGAAATFAVAYGAGSLLNDAINARLTEQNGGRPTTLGSLYYDRMHNADGSFRWQGIFSTETAAEADARLERQRIQTVRPGGQQTPMMINNTIVMPNGRVLAEIVTEQRAEAWRRPVTGAGRFDGRVLPAPVGG